MILRNCLKRTILFFLTFLVCLLLAIGCRKDDTQQADVVSEFGKYQGYSNPIYQQWERSSQYVEMKDGIKLATDIIRPVENGLVIPKALPVVWAYYRYHRAREKDGNVLSLVDLLPPLQTLIKHGYVIVVVDARGTGASFGSNESKGPNTLQEAQHTYQITEWIAAQVWCDGNVGMFGHSYSGNVQFLAAAQAPSHLKAVFPSGAAFDVYELMYPGGVFLENFAKTISNSLHYWDIEADAVPVDGDSNGLLLKEANLEHRKNVDPFDFFTELPCRDSRYKGYQFWLEGNPLIYLSACNVSRIPIYQWIGWKDFLIRDAFQWFVNLEGPQKLSVGWWSHDIHSSYDLLAVEQLRWFDYWLKGIDNSIMDESPIHYTCIDDPDSNAWYQANLWPLPESQQTEFYFVPGGPDSAQPVYDGLLLSELDQKEKWQEEIRFPDSKELTFTTQPLEKELFVIGHPVITLYLTAMVTDVDIYITLKDVDESNNVFQVTTGILRASHRTSTKPPFNNIDLPYQRHYAEDVKSMLIGKPAELCFDLLPVAKCFQAGHQIQISVKYAYGDGSEKDNSVDFPNLIFFGSPLKKTKIVLPVIRI